MSMIPKGGDTIWGGLDWSPEEGYLPSKRRKLVDESEVTSKDENKKSVSQRKVNYGRIISFGKDVAEAPASEIERIEFMVSAES